MIRFGRKCPKELPHSELTILASYRRDGSLQSPSRRHVKINFRSMVRWLFSSTLRLVEAATESAYPPLARDDLRNSMVTMGSRIYTRYSPMLDMEQQSIYSLGTQFQALLNIGMMFLEAIEAILDRSATHAAPVRIDCGFCVEPVKTAVESIREIYIDSGSLQ